jgi:hypothetical protein
VNQRLYAERLDQCNLAVKGAFRMGPDVFGPRPEHEGLWELARLDAQGWT